MATAGTAYIELRAKLDQFERDLRSVESSASRSGSRIGSKLDTGMRSKLRGLSDFGKKLGRGLAIGAGAGVAALGFAAKNALEAAQEAAEVGAQTEAVLKSTSGAANVTAEEIDNLATKISLYSAIEDDAIKQGQNMLLTFTNIRNEVGEGNDIFNQASETLVDLSVGMGQDMKSSAIQLGKALNDPIKGVSALSRVGVQFTEKQKKMIERLVESGDTMKAQKVILAELTTQFGGSARKVGNTKSWDKMKNAIGEVMESIGTALLPTVNDLADRLSRFVQSEKFREWMEKAEDWLKNKLPDAIDKFGSFVRNDLAPALETTVNLLSRMFGFLRDAWNIMDKMRAWTPPNLNPLSGLDALGAIGNLLPGGDDGGPTASGQFGSAFAMGNHLMAKFPGLVATSGYRPGDDGYHGDANNPAIDLAMPGWPSDTSGVLNAGAVAIFHSAIAAFGSNIREMIYGHAIYERGRLGYYSPTDHFGHIHLADMGAIVKGPAMIAQGNITEAHIPLSGPGAKGLTISGTLHIPGIGKAILEGASIQIGRSQHQSARVTRTLGNR